MLNKLSLVHPAWIEVDLQQFKNNIALIQKRIQKTKLCIPIKANAYGHGLLPIARAAEEAKVDYLGVACLQEGIQLRNAGIQIPILVFGAIHEDQIPDLLHYQLEFTIASLYKAKMVAKQCLSSHQKCKIHVEIDTGMQRTGVRPDTAIHLLNYLYNEPCFEIVGLYSHLAVSDDPNNDFTQYQIKQFQDFVQHHIRHKHPDIICHLANSGGICYFPNSYFDMVRPGLLAFGHFPGPLPIHTPIQLTRSQTRTRNKIQDKTPTNKQGNPHINPLQEPQEFQELQDIKSIFSVKAKIAYFKVVESDQGISYGHTYKTTEQTRVVTIPIGYGDGLRRELSNRGSVIIGGKRFPISGTICMDQFMVDIHHNEAYVGDEIVLIGKQGEESITLEEMAKLCNTITYEILCGFNNRLPRYYHDVKQAKRITFLSEHLSEHRL